MWVQLLAPKVLELAGSNRSYAAGDWVEVGKQLALHWLSTGDAQIYDTSKLDLAPKDAGIVITGGEAVARAAFERYSGDQEVVYGPPALRFKKTLLWDASLMLRFELVPVGFQMLDKWQLCIPLWSYTELAVHVGKPKDRERTAAVVRDLRVPLYDTRLIFARRGPKMQRLVRLWQEGAREGDTRLAFLRALYQVKPLVLALPTAWKVDWPAKRA